MYRLALRITSTVSRALVSSAPQVTRPPLPTARPPILGSLTPLPLRFVAEYSTHAKFPAAETVIEESETVSGDLELESADPQRRFLLAFTCKVCNTRQSKLVTHHAYTQGVVLARCDGCQNVHLISDNKNWFMEGRNVEEIVQKQDPTEKVQKLTFRAKDAQSQAYLERLLKEDPALLERLARAKVEAMRKAAAEGDAPGDGGNPTSATVRITVPSALSAA